MNAILYSLLFIIIAHILLINFYCTILIGTTTNCTTIGTFTLINLRSEEAISGKYSKAFFATTIQAYASEASI